MKIAISKPNTTYRVTSGYKQKNGNSFQLKRILYRLRFYGAVLFLQFSASHWKPGTQPSHYNNQTALYKDTGKGTTWTKLWVGINVSLLIRFAACFNYTNLTIFRALTRAKETGIRNIAGAKRYQLFLQYIVESVLLSLAALAPGWVILGFLIEYAPFNDS